MGLLLAMSLLVAADLPQPFELGPVPSSITLVAPGDAELRRRVQQVVSDPGENLVLRLGELAAEADPGVSWEVHATPAVVAPETGPGSLVGVLALYGAGPDAEFVFVLDAALAADACGGVHIVFVPVSGLDSEDAAAPVVVRSRVTVGTIRLEAEEPAPP